MGPDSSGMPPEHSQTLLGHFWTNHLFGKKTDIMKTPTGRKTVFFPRGHDNHNKKKNASPRLELWWFDDLPIFHMEPNRGKNEL